jgi:phytoene dehydrogenase-like protein
LEHHRHVVIVGGGNAGLAAGCYARSSGFRTTIIEHNIALGGVCTAWRRGPYVVDGCIHWLTGGPFARLYEELGIVPAVELRTLNDWATWRSAGDGEVIRITRDLEALARDLARISPPDAPQVAQLLEAASRFAEVTPPGVDRPHELTTFREQVHALWDMRSAFGTFLHFRKPIREWTDEHLKSEVLRRFFTSLVPEGAPALVLLMILGYLRRGYLSRPVGGTASFRDALIGTYERLGGATTLHATVDEILVDGGRARGVRLDDGSIVSADAVVSTSSGPETVLRLLGGRFGADEMRERMKNWAMFPPTVLASFGVGAPLGDVPSMLVVDGLPPFEVGGRKSDRLYLRICNDDASLAPPGHSVVQALVETDYTWWATRGADYGDAKDGAARVVLDQVERAIPGVRDFVRMTDVVTPLTFWRHARSWRGAYEGWLPSADALFGHIRKKLAGLEGFYMAGQWVERDAARALLSSFSWRKG